MRIRKRSSFLKTLIVVHWGKPIWLGQMPSEYDVEAIVEPSIWTTGHLYHLQPSPAITKLTFYSVYYDSSPSMLGSNFISSLLAVAALSIPYVHASSPDLVVSCGVNMS